MTIIQEAEELINDLETIFNQISADKKLSRCQELIDSISDKQKEISKSFHSIELPKPKSFNPQDNLIMNIQNIIQDFENGNTPTNLQKLNTQLKDIQKRIDQFKGLSAITFDINAIENQKTQIQTTVNQLINHMSSAQHNLKAKTKHLINETNESVESFIENISDPMNDFKEELIKQFEDTGIETIDEIEGCSKAITELINNADKLIDEIETEFNSLAALFGDINTALPAAQGGIGVALEAIEETQAAIDEALSFA